ncbi:MAG: aspartate aminotransferase family protein [Pirellulales bacterium]|nr:aspartate aminotransferase family protein [Pirellulales bacterium]
MNADASDKSEIPSARLYARAKQVLPGGVSRNTVFRRPHPVYAVRGNGCRVTDLEDVERIDFSNNMASLIHGHAHPAIVSAVSEQLQRGSAFALGTEAEVIFAEQLCARAPGFEKIRFVNSGTEAVMTALKAARAFTDRPKIAKVEGAYHGAYDYAEVSQTAKPANWGDPQNPACVPVAKGTPAGALKDVVVLPFNNPDCALELLNQHADEIACVLIDPLPHRVGFIWAEDEFVTVLHEWTRQHGALLVFDEVITFRCNFSGAQQRYSVRPDLTALGKMIGGGFPVGAVAGRDDVMCVLDPTRDDLPYPHSGTFSANPISMVAGSVAMQLFDQDAIDQVNALGDSLRQRMTEAIRSINADACVTGDASLFRLHLKPQPPTDFRSCYAGPDEARQLRVLVDHLFDNGVTVINTCSGALSTPMTERDIDHLVDVVKSGLARVKSLANESTI